METKTPVTPYPSLTAQDVHGGLIRFRAQFGAKPTSSSSTCQKQFDQWSQVVGIADADAKMTESIKDLHEFYRWVLGKCGRASRDGGWQGRDVTHGRKAGPHTPPCDCCSAQFPSELSSQASQQRLDTLTVVLGFLGLAAIIIDVRFRRVDGGLLDLPLTAAGWTESAGAASVCNAHCTRLSVASADLHQFCH